jgi:hypothetical protein
MQQNFGSTGEWNSIPVQLIGKEVTLTLMEVNPVQITLWKPVA